MESFLFSLCSYCISYVGMAWATDDINSQWHSHNDIQSEARVWVFFLYMQQHRNLVQILSHILNAFITLVWVLFSVFVAKTQIRHRTNLLHYQAFKIWQETVTSCAFYVQRACCVLNKMKFEGLQLGKCVRGKGGTFATFLGFNSFLCHGVKEQTCTMFFQHNVFLSLICTVSLMHHICF